MKIKLFVLTAFTAFAFAIVSPTTHAETTMEKIVRTGKITIAVQTQGPPASFVDKNGKRTGLVIEIARLMAEDMNVKLVVQDYDWKGLIPALLSKKADFIAADMTPTAKRSMRVLFTEPVFFSEIIAFSTTKNGYNSWQELNAKGITVGATQATSFAEIARAELPKSKLKEFAGGTAQVVQALVAGRIKAGISDKANFSAFITSFKGLKMLDGTLSREPLGFAVRPDSMHLLISLNNYMRLIRTDGRLDKLVDYWWNSNAWEADHK